VDLTDLSDVLNNFGLVSGNNVVAAAQSQSFALNASAAPEPASIALLALAAPTLLIRRRKFAF
jgi:hypothetical protein